MMPADVARGPEDIRRVPVVLERHRGRATCLLAWRIPRSRVRTLSCQGLRLR